MRRRNWRLLPRGLGWRLTAVTLGLTTVCLLLFGGAGTLLLHRSLTQEVDARLHTLLAGPFLEGPPPDAEARSVPFPTDLRTLTVDADGEVVDVVGRTSSDTAIPDVSAMSVGQLRERAGRPFTVPGIYGESRWRVVTSPQDDGTVQVAAQSLEDVDGTLRQLTLIEIRVGLVVLILLGFAAVATVRLQLRPLHEIEATAQGIAEGNLDRRIPDQDPATEAGRLGAALNAMLSGLSRAMLERGRSVAVTRRFVADASHELRTPLSSIRGFAELYRQGRAQGVVAEDPRADRWMSRIEEEAGRMAGLVEDLLLLARFDEAPMLDRTDIELGEIAEQVAAGVRVRTRETRIDVEVPAPVHAVGDAERMRQVLENLVGNAVTHTPPGTPVGISVRRSAAAPPAGAASIGALPAGTAEAAVVVVRDQGPGIPEERVTHLFERFYRVDESCSRGGAGLGLSISASFVIAHGGFITVDSAPGRGTAFTLAIPAGG
ncbi:two-component system OmpR family sensor kinase [Lipingzhangella halophila]|uniref:histidine kinase n=1 Tax=Lipingzhangella halophila TaxID=1783352 RepID=A0A7W7W4L3_9ACTN|nr:HAMP domain-containing sensor histidine kinase [Lipingzhangella halophila]MBB4932850.1 two-component system OmpR family sensor kinase [Lipingzhangella halophila]